MKKEFFDEIDKWMEKDPNIFLIMAGLGYPRTEEFLKKYPGRAINTEASEQTALDIAVGLAYSHKKVFVYTITPFLYRGFETIRTYINHEKLPVRLVGVGRDDDYKDDGFSHDATDADDVFKLFRNIQRLTPQVKEDIPTMVKMMMEDRPWFISLRR